MWDQPVAYCPARPPMKYDYLLMQEMFVKTLIPYDSQILQQFLYSMNYLEIYEYHLQ